MARIVIYSMAYRGDVFPYAPVAAELARRGHRVTFEERVVSLVAEGLTNPQIAERMFIARGTVKVHPSHVFTKLGVSTRSELAAQATKHASKAS
jgi:DNA-binding NarL/FixJ family response regulator